MAVAGINNVSVLESMGWGNQDRSITRTSLIRKLWRDLEDENRNREVERQHTSGKSYGNMRSRCSCSSDRAESENVSVSTSEAENECPRDKNQMVIQNVQVDNENLCLQRSHAISVSDKERMKQVFREWGSKNTRGLSMNVSHKNKVSGGQSICEDEFNRVRTVRKWIESSSQQAETGDIVKEEQAPEVDCQAERVHDGSRKSIRRLYGRQALVETLTKFEMEREKEMKNLMESRLVSNFAHRNRIQAMFRGRFLSNQIFVQDEKPSSTATSELGRLSPTNTVSDLRKGFLSRSDSDEQSYDGSQSDTSSDNGIGDHSQNFHHLLDVIHNKFQAINTRSNLGTKKFGIPIKHESPVEEKHDQVLENEGEQLSPPTRIAEIRDQDQDGLVENNHCAQPIEPSHQTMELGRPSLGKHHSSDEEQKVNVAFGHFNHSETKTEILSNVESSYSAHSIEPFQQTFKLGSTSHGQLQSNDEELKVSESFGQFNRLETKTEIFSNVESSYSAHSIGLSQPTLEFGSPSQGQCQSNDEELEVNEAFGHFNYLETNTEILHNVDELNVNEAYDHLSQSETRTETLSNGEEQEVNYSSHHLNHSETSTEILSNVDELEVYEEFDPLNHSETNTETFSWQECSVEVGCQEANGSEWHHLTSIESNEGLDVNSVENEDEWIQETNVNDVQESHDAWYTFDDDTGTRLELRQLTSRRRVSNLLQSGFRVRLDQVIQSYVDNHHLASESEDEWISNQQSADENNDGTESVEMTEADVTGTDWEIINGMRLDMVLLQERMNNMQRTLETCMKMQLELQHSVHQEVSSALNRSSTSGEDCLQTCSLCCDFESPDRCGHIYVCPSCAEKINWTKLKASIRHP